MVMRDTKSEKITPGQEASALEHGTLGYFSVLFQSIVFAGPAVGVGLSLVFGAAIAGGATPLYTLLTVFLILLIAISIAQLARYLPSAGGLYTYVAAGLGELPGFIVAWLLFAAYLLVDAALIVLLLGIIGQANLVGRVDEGLDWTWAPIVIVALLAVLFIVIRGVRPTTKIQVVMGIFEMAVFVVLAIHLLIIADHHTLDVFKPSTGNPGGMGDIFTAMIFGVLAYVGFESATTLGEEARDPRRAIPLAVIGAVLVIGAFFTLSMYASVAYWGPDQIEGGNNAFVNFNGGDPWDGIADRLWGGAWVFILIAILNSTWAGLLAEVNAASRVGFALGRVRILPEPLAAVHRRWRTPWIAATFICLLGIAIALILGYALDGPGDALNFLVAIGVPMFCVIYAITAISCTVFYWRQHRDEFNILLHGVIPLAGALFFIPVLCGAVGIDLPYVDISGLVGPARFGPWIGLGWLLIGFVAYYFFRTNRPESIQQLDRIFVHDDGIEDQPPRPPAARPDVRA